MADQRTLRVVIVGNASQAQAALRGLGGEASRLERRTGGLSGGFATMGGKLMAFGRMAGLGLGAAAVAAGAWGVKTASEMEQAQAGFTTMLGSAKKATDFLAQLKAFAVKTPFSTEDVVKYSQSLMAMGFNAKDVIPTLRNAGDAVAAMGGSPEKLQRVLLALGQIKAKGKLMASEMMQITENGIGGWQMIADHMHKTVPEVMALTQKGAISSDQAISAMMEGMHKKFGGMMDQQSNSVAGMWSTLQDTAQLALGDMMKAFFPLIKVALPKLTTGVAALAKILVPAFAKIGEVIGPVTQKMQAGFGSKVMPVLKQVASFIMGTLVPYWKSMGAQILPVLMKIGSIIGSSVLPLLGAIGKAILPVLKTIANVVSHTVMPAFTGLMAIILPRFQMFVNFLRTQIVPVLSGMFKQAQPVIQQLGHTIGTVMQGIGVAIKVLTPVLQILWKFLGPIVISTLQGLWSGILGVIKGALNVIEGVVNIFIGIFTGNWSKAWSGVKQVFTGIWQAIVGAFKVYIYGEVVGVVRGGLAKVAGFWRAGWGGIKAAFTAVVNFIKGGVSGWVSGIGGIISRGISFVKGIWNLGWSGIKTVVQVHIRFITSLVRDLPGQIVGFFTRLPGELRTIGSNIIQGLIRGIKGAWGAVTGVVSSLVDKIPGPIRKMLGIHSPSRVMAEIGKFIGQGLVVGMQGTTKHVAAAAGKLHKAITLAFQKHKISGKRANQLHKWLHNEDVKLWRLAASREAVAKRLGAAQKKLADLKKAHDTMASNVAQKAKDFGSVMGVFDSSEYGDNSASAMLGRLKEKLAGIIKFRQNLSTLAKRGLGKSIIDEIAQAGPDQGGPMAQALLNAGVGQIKQLNSTYSAIQSQSNALGKSVADDYYGAGIHATQGLIKGLQSQENKLTKAITKLSASMVKALKKALGIHSPSRVFAGLGVFTGQGFAKGIDDSNGHVQAAIDRMAGTRPSGKLSNASIHRERHFGHGYGHAAPVVHVTVQGNVTAEKALAKAIATTVRDEIVRNGKRNGGRTGF